MDWPYLVLIIIGILVIIIAVFYVWLKLNFNPIPTGKIAEDVYSIKTSIVNAFIYTKGSESILIDAGAFSKIVKKELQDINIKPSEIAHIFITHADPDHVGGLSIFSGAQVYFGEASKTKYSENYHFLQDSELVQVGEIKVEVISTPGHRIGHVAYLVDEKYLFTGDLLRLTKKGVKPFFRVISKDCDQICESISKIAAITNIKAIYTAHTGYTDDVDKIMDEWE